MDPLRSSDATLIELVEAVRDLPYGRPSDRSVDGMLRERRGTCSTKHGFLWQALVERFPATDPEIVHRVYRIDREAARRLYGEAAADAVPADGLVDVHRYLMISTAAGRVTLDATFPGPRWDGRSALPVAAPDGRDYPAGDEPDAEKRRLESEFCDPHVREPFIAALSRGD